MAIFIEISGKCYKVPNQITIGRGEPFSQFNDNRRVSRTHFCMTVSKGKIYIKDLGTSKDGLIINGKKIKPKTHVMLNANDEIVFADEKMRILTTAPSEYVEIKKTTAGKIHRFDYYKIILYVPVLAFAFKMFSLFNEPKFDYSMALSSLMICSAFIYMGHLYVKFHKRIAVDFLKEVTFNNEGFTTYTTDNVNMTFAFDKIDSWSIHGETVLKISAHGQEFEYAMDKNFEDFKKYLHRNLAAKKVTNENLRYKRGGLFSIFVLGLQLAYEFTNPGVQYLGFGILSVWIIACLSMLFNKDLRKYWFIQVGKKTTPLFQTGSIVATALYTFTVISTTYADMKKHELNLAAAASCSKQNKESCLKVDYWLTYATETKYKNQELACELGNKTACPLRSPASIKK
jgi:hypothetical protein